MQAEAANQLIEQTLRQLCRQASPACRTRFESTCYNLKKQEVKRAAVADECGGVT
jgi:hypothetical protein